MSLSNQLKSRLCNLRKVSTRVTLPDGRVFQEIDGKRVTEDLPTLGFVADLKPDLQVGRVCDHLFIGSQDVANDVSLLSRYGITDVLNVAAVANCQYPGVNYLVVAILDLPEEPLRDHFRQCFDFIDQGIQRKSSVLVHCNAGISRSVSIIVAYLMYRFKWSLDKALLAVKNARPSAQPNPGFLKQLLVYEQYLNSESSLSQAQLENNLID